MKILIKMIILVIIFSNFGFLFCEAGSFEISTNLSTEKQELMKKQANVIFDKVNNKISNLDKIKQIELVKAISKKIDSILQYKKQENTRYVFLYLQFLLNDKINLIENNLTNDQELVIEAICSIKNGTGSQKVKLFNGKIINTSNCEIKSCNKGYVSNELNECILENKSKSEEKINQDIITSEKRACNIQNGLGEEEYTYKNGKILSKTNCLLKTCNSGYEINSNSCVIISNSNSNNVIVAQEVITTEKRACNIQNGIGEGYEEVTFKNGNYFKKTDCILNTCNAGYRLINNTCEKLPYFTNGTTTYPGCDSPDIIVGTYTLSACNVGSNKAGTGIESYGYYFQWGNNYGSVSGGPTTSTLVDASGYGPGNYYNSSPNFIISYDLEQSRILYYQDWSTIKNNNLWGGITNTNDAKQGPCAFGYHIPTRDEWNKVFEAGKWIDELRDISNDLKLPKSGFRDFGSGNIAYEGLGYYWTSSPNYEKSWYELISTTFSHESYPRGFGLSVRCFKN